MSVPYWEPLHIRLSGLRPVLSSTLECAPVNILARRHVYGMTACGMLAWLRAQYLLGGGLGCEWGVLYLLDRGCKWSWCVWGRG